MLSSSASEIEYPKMFVAAGRQLFELDSNGSVLASADLGSDIHSTPAVAKGVVYVGLEDGRVVGLRAPELQQTVFTFQSGQAVLSSVAVVDGELYFSSQDNKLYRVAADNAADSTVLLITGEDAAFGSSDPVVVKGWIYIGTNADTLYVVK